MADPSDSELALDSIDGVIRLLSHWMAKSPDGWATVVFRSYFSAEKTIQRLQAANGAETVPIVDPGINDEALSTLLSQIKVAKPGQTLLVKLGPQSEEFFGLLNLHRENIQDHSGVRIVFWMGQEAYRRLLHAARDFESWVQLRLRLEELPPAIPALEERSPLVPASVAEWSEDERLRVEEATARIHKARAAGIEEEEIWRDILAPTLDRLMEQGVRQASIRWFVEMRVPATRIGLLLDQCDRLIRWGELDLAERFLIEEGFPIDSMWVYGRLADILAQRGELGESLRIQREILLPISVKLGERERAMTQGKIADILVAGGNLDEALRHYQQDVAPVFAKLGDARSLVVTLGKIADILEDRGYLHDALRIHQDGIPVYSRLGDLHSLAVTYGKIADILVARGELDEALRIRQREEVPVFSKLGDLHSLAVTRSKIADILKARGELDEALRIHRQEGIPAYSRLGDIRGLALTQGRIADILMVRGDPDEALRIRQQEEIPAYSKLGDLRELAVSQSKIADILRTRGDLDGAIQRYREEVLPVLTRLGIRKLVAEVEANLATILRQRAKPGDIEESRQLLTHAHHEARAMGLPLARQIEDSSPDSKIGEDRLP